MSNQYITDDHAVNTLLESGAELIRLRPDKSPREPRDWPTYQRSFDDLLDHDGLLGLLPSSLGLTVLDVDIGDASRLVQSFPPKSMTASRRLDGAHLFYKHKLPIPNQAWAAPVFGVGGDIRSRRNGYVVLWDAVRLVRDLEREERESAATLEDVTAALVIGTPQGPPTGLESPDPDANAETGATPQGRHNHVLQRLIAARCDGMSVSSIQRYAVTLWRSLPVGAHPFARAEVSRIAEWVGRHSWDSASQRQRGVLSGVARRARTASRDEAIRVALAEGESVHALSRKYAVSRTAIRNVRDRKAALGN